MKRPQLVLLAILAALFAIGVVAYSGTVVTSTTTYPGADVSGQAPTALPAVGAYYFDMVAVATPTTTSPFSGLIVYLQQQGIAGGAYYTVFNSTFPTCGGPCTGFVVPDMYLGGNVRAYWTVTAGSATVTVTARPVNP